MANPSLVPQGTLNRIRCSIVFPNFPGLNITASYMGKSMASLSFDGNIVEKIKTATGTVDSPEPYQMAGVSVGILRTQPLASAWLAQIQNTGILGPATVYPDTSALAPYSLEDVSVTSFNPTAFDGTDPTVHLVLNGIYYINADLWNLT